MVFYEIEIENFRGKGRTYYVVFIMITVTLNRAILGVGFDGALHVSVTLDSWAPVVSSNCTLGESVKNESYKYKKKYIISLLCYLVIITIKNNARHMKQNNIDGCTF